MEGLSRKPGILIVEDRKENIYAIRKILEKLDVELIIAETGNEALRHCLNNDFAAIIMDVGLPDMDGFEVARLLYGEERTRHFPIIFVTATHFDDYHKFKGYKVGALDYITKPIVKPILLGKLQVLLELYQKRMEIGALLGEMEDKNKKLAGEIERRKLVEEELRQTAEDLERSNRELEQFAYVASHDLLEPLRKVKSFTVLLSERCGEKLDEKGARYAGYIVEGAGRMEDLIMDLLKYSRVRSGSVSMVRTSMKEVLDQAISELEAVVRDSAAEITADDLPEINANPTQMRQLLENLIGNAIKYRGDEAPKVRLAAERQTGNWLFRVSDNGIGIDPEHHDRIFTIFHRLHSQEKYSGTGIGLAICKKIVESHNGKIWVESAPGKGSSFCFSLPDGEEEGVE